MNIICLLRFFAIFIAFGSINALADQSSLLEEPAKGSAGIGLAGIADWSTQYPFLDQMKLAREWQVNGNDSATETLNLDAQGWIASIEKGISPSTVFLTGNEGLPIVYKNYIVEWQGDGLLKYDWCARKVGEINGADRIQIHCTDSSLMTIVETNPDNPIRNITIVPEKHYALFTSGQVFNPDFIEKIKEFRALRFMDWMMTNGSKQKEWSDRPLPDDRTYATKGVPLEVIIALSNLVSADLWVNIPHQADINYIRELARLTKKLVNPSLTVYIEHSNEVWNWVFPQTLYALEEGKKLFQSESGDVFLQWHGARTAQMCEIWKSEVYSNEKNKVVCVLGVQAGWPGAEIASLDCPLWVKKGNTPCIENGIDALAITGYFSGCLNGGDNKVHQRKIIGWGQLKDKGLGRSYEQVLEGKYFECEDSLFEVNKIYTYFAKEASRRGIDLLAYEGGQHITSNMGSTQDDERFSDLHIMLNRSPYMKKLYQSNFKNWVDAGGGLFMHFVDASAFTKYGSWGALEYITQETSPKWEALMEFNQAPCWWKNCQLVTSKLNSTINPD